MHTLLLFLAGMLGCAALYAVAGVLCFKPGSATYSTETPDRESGWFSRIEELMVSRDATAQAAAATSESARSRDQDIALPARLIGPSPRAWFFNLDARYPIASVVMHPWVKCWRALQGDHFPPVSSFQIPLGGNVQGGEALGSVVLVHHIQVSWSNASRLRGH
jgi:hypothetical protein